MLGILNSKKITRFAISAIAVVAVGFFWWVDKIANTRLSIPDNSAVFFPFVKNTPEARDGTIRLGQNEQGIVILGRVSGAPPQWPRTADEMAAKDHIEVWVADAKPTELPPVGWGNQLGYEQLNGEAGCLRFTSDFMKKTSPHLQEDCKQWYRQQIKYRESLKKLFIRQWQIAPNVVSETYALPAFRSFDKTAQDKLVALKPSGTPQVKVAIQNAEGQAYNFEILIPWDALPPVQSLQLKDLRILVDVFSPGTGKLKYGPYSTISIKREYGDSSSFVLFTLPAPREYIVTPCRYDSQDAVISTEPKRGYLVSSQFSETYYFPAKNTDVEKLIVLDNEAIGYQYEPSVESRSPVVLPAPYWTENINGKEILCGPRLASFQNGKIFKTDFIVDSKDALKTKQLSNGDTLIKDGPRVWSSYFASGQCGTCPRVSLNIYYLDRRSNIITQAFNYLGVTEAESNDIDIVVSPDWNTINIFDQNPVTYCFKTKNRKYEKCGK